MKIKFALNKNTKLIKLQRFLKNRSLTTADMTSEMFCDKNSTSMPNELQIYAMATHIWHTAATLNIHLN